jgi:hypothetical protein
MGDTWRLTGVARPPRRWTDRLEDVAAWLLIAAALLAVMAAVAIGGSTLDRASARAAAESAARTRTGAVLLEPAPVLPGRTGVTMVAARWTVPGGRTAEGRIAVSSGAPAGAVVTVWVDSSGSVVPPPLTRLDAELSGVVSGLLVLAVGGLGLAGAWAGVRAWIGARNAAAWEREWAGVEPVWRRNLR